MAIEDVLNEREKAHGDFKTVCELEQRLRAVMGSAPNWEKLSAVERSALEMDALKTARILCGDHALRDHWEDKAGYATLAAQRCGIAAYGA